MRPEVRDVLNRRDEVLAGLFEFLRIPSVSALPEHAGDVRACAEHVAGFCRRIGLETEICPTQGHPAVIARTPRRPGRPTLLIYGHYDVQPADPDTEPWEHPPFDPVIVDDCIRARGASDDKGPVYAHLVAVESMIRHRGESPVNVTFLLEGEEEIGSPHLVPLIESRRADLACDAIVISDTAQYKPGVPAICYGLRGLVYLEVIVEGPGSDLHSGAFGGAVENPANVLARLLASLFNEQGRVAIEGFYDAVRPMSSQEREELARLGFDESAFCREAGVVAPGGDPAYSVLERIGARPALDVNGLVSGHIGPGPKTVLPARATAKFSMRLVPDQDPDEIARRTIAHLQSGCPSTVRMRIIQHGAGRPVLVDLNAPEMSLAREALAEGFGAEPVFLREGGSIPIVASLIDVCRAPCLLLGFGRHDDNLHAPNEKFHVEDFFSGVATSVGLLHRFGERGDGAEHTQ